MTTLLTYVQGQMLHFYITMAMPFEADIEPRCGWSRDLMGELNQPIGNFIGLSLSLGQVFFVVIIAALALGAVLLKNHRGNLIGGAIGIVVFAIILNSGINPVSSPC